MGKGLPPFEPRKRPTAPPPGKIDYLGADGDPPSEWLMLTIAFGPVAVLVVVGGLIALLR